MNNQHPNHEPPADLHGVAQQVDTLAAAQRASAKAGFEARIHGATVELLRADRLKLVPAPFVITPARRWISPMRIAAAVAVLSTIGVTYLATHGQLKSHSPTMATIDVGMCLSPSSPCIGPSG